jgi:hypothetical protein
MCTDESRSYGQSQDIFTYTLVSIYNIKESQYIINF